MTSQEQNQSTSDTFDVEISGIANGGDGITRHAGKTYFVPFTIPGEVLSVRVTADKGRYAFAEGVTMQDASADRVTPRCQHFGPGQCANCQWQHMNAEAQQALKTDILIDQLERIGQFDSDELVIHPIISSPQQWGYATRADFYRTPDGGLGYPALDERRALPISECHIVRPRILEVLDELDFAIDNLRWLRIQIGDDETAMLTLQTIDEEAPGLTSTLPVSINLLLNDNVPVNLVGDTHFEQTLLERTFRVTAGVSFRANPPQHEQLIQTVLDYLAFEGYEMVLDLYGGVGVFSAFIAPHVSHITYVDSYPPAATDAEENLSDFEHVDIIEGSVEEVVPYLQEMDFFYNVAIVDPPADGLSVEALDALSNIDVPLIVYIGQDAATFARDAKRLVNNHAYTLTDIQPLDFAPQTAAVEVIAIFERHND